MRGRYNRKILRTRLPTTMNKIFEACQLLETHRPPCVHFTRRNPDLCAHTEFTAIGELCGRGTHLSCAWLLKNGIDIDIDRYWY